MSAPRKQKILIVEDEFFLAETLQARLEYSDYDVAHVENGAEAITYLESNKVDLILMDVMMPEMDGWEATKIIKGDKRFQHIPVVMLSARVQKEDKEKALEVGANDYMTKPFESNELVEVIHKYLRK